MTKQLPQKLASGTQPQCDGTVIGTMPNRKACVPAKSHIPDPANIVMWECEPTMSDMSLLKNILNYGNLHETFWFIYFIYSLSCFEILW